MRLPIMYTMSWPARNPVTDKTWPRLDFTKTKDLTFRAPDRLKYPALDLAYAAGRSGGTMTCVLSAANEQVRTALTHLCLSGSRAGKEWLKGWGTKAILNQISLDIGGACTLRGEQS